jgi:Trk K+ transport system NAD-binding subunit
MLSFPKAENSPQRENASPITLDKFLVCGLGSLGQHCLAALAEFGIIVNAIDVETPKNWDVPKARESLAKLFIGDCRQPKVLEEADIRRCRAILLVSSNESVNVAGAFAARRLNPDVRIIIRSSKQNLNELLGQQLRNFAAFDATQLPASAFALAALGEETLGFFSLEGQLLRVVKHKMHPNHRWCGQPVYERNHRLSRVLSYITDNSSLGQEFYRWDADALVAAGDTLVRIETADSSAQYFFTDPGTFTQQNLREFWQQARSYKMNWRILQKKLVQFWQSTSERRIQRVAIVALIAVFILLSLGITLIKLAHPDSTIEAAFYNTAIFLLGGFGDQVGGFQPKFSNPWWLNLFGLQLTIAGTVFVGILYATLTDVVLSSRFQFSRRQPIPKQDHVVLVGLGRVGQRVATILQELNQPFVGVTHTSEFDSTLLPNLPLVTGDITTNLQRVNLVKAKSLIVATDDEMANLEIALMAQAENPASHLVIRTYDPSFTQSLAEILPKAKVVCAYALAAEAFAGAAFGEHIISLFRLNQQTILVTEFKIQAEDNLNGLLLAEVAYGYEVVPLLHQKLEESARLMPSEEIRLEVGDRLVILATINGLQRIERGEMAPRRWALWVEEAMSKSAVLEGGNTICRLAGCEISMARELMQSLPGALRLPLYKQQAQNLVRELRKVQVKARLGFVKKARVEILQLQPDESQ